MRDFCEENRWAEYRKYIHSNKLTDYERRLLRRWVKDGHSVNEHVESRYLPMESDPSMDFIDAYRHDRMLKRELAGMTPTAKDAYMRNFFGSEYTAPIVNESVEDRLVRANSEIRTLERNLFLLNMFLMESEMKEAADNYVDVHSDDVLPFE